MTSTQSQGNVTLSREDLDRLILRATQQTQQQGGQTQQQNNGISPDLQQTLAGLLQELKYKDQLIQNQQEQINTQHNQHLDTVLEREHLVVETTPADLHLGSLSGTGEVTVRRAKDNSPVPGLLLKFYTSVLNSRQIVATATTNIDGVAKAVGVARGLGSVSGGASGYIVVFDGDRQYKNFEVQQAANITTLGNIF
jgi:hypothetical protein